MKRPIGTGSSRYDPTPARSRPSMEETRAVAPSKPSDSLSGISWVRYLALLALQTAGAIAIYWKVIPIYRAAIMSPADHVASLAPVIWCLAAALPMQAAYWYGSRLPLPIFQSRHVVLGHGLLFSAR